MTLHSAVSYSKANYWPSLKWVWIYISGSPVTVGHQGRWLIDSKYRTTVWWWWLLQ